MINSDASHDKRSKKCNVVHAKRRSANFDPFGSPKF